MLPIIQSTKVRDPVCGMMVDPHHAAGSVEHNGHTYHFCSKGCAVKFQADPERYLHPAAAPEPMEAQSEGIEYTCPMHPEIRQLGPGSCPICGMALEPVAVTAEDGPSPELRDMTLRFWVGLALAVPVFVLEMGGHLIGHMLSPHLSNW